MTTTTGETPSRSVAALQEAVQHLLRGGKILLKVA